MRVCDLNDRFVHDRKIHGSCDEAICMRRLMQLLGPLPVGARRQGDPRPQRYLDELACPSCLFLDHCAFGAVFIGQNDHSGSCAEAHVPKLVTGRQRCHEKFFRIPAPGISPEDPAITGFPGALIS